MAKMFCDACERQANYTTIDKIREVTVRGQVMNISYKAKICGNCGEELYDDALEIQILRNAQAIYREQHKMASPSAIQAYMREHNLSVEQMAAKVGCAVSKILRVKEGGLVDEETDAAIKAAIA